MMTNADFVQKDKKFKEACEKVNIPPTKRQASKWRRGMGLAWKKGQ